MPSELERAARQFRNALLSNERAAASEMVRAYGASWRRIDAELRIVQEQIAAARAAGLVPDTFTPRLPGGPVVPRTPGTFTPAWLYERDRLASLQRQVEVEMRQFSALATELTEAGQLQAVQAGINSSQALLEIATNNTGLAMVLDRLPIEAVQELVGFASDGSPLRALFDALGPDVSRGIRDALSMAVATGMGPRETARLVRRRYGMGLARALRIARTEQIRAYREATHQNYLRNVDLLDGWVWLSAANRRTCPSCWGMHGTRHPLTERLDDHPQGRCVMVPIVKGRPLAVPTGEALFQELPVADQVAVLGQAGRLAWSEGAVKLADFVGRKNDPQWGTMRYAKSLRQVLGKEKALEWVRRERTLRNVMSKALGADVNRLSVLQATRLAELTTQPSAELSRLRSLMAQATRLPKAKEHFIKHGLEFADLGVTTTSDLEALFSEHIRRDDLRTFSYISTQRQQYRMWVLWGIDNDVAVLYNESKRQYWSIMHQPAMLDGAKGWWVEVSQWEPLKVEKW